MCISRRFQFNLRTAALLIGLHAVFAHCLVVMGRATLEPPMWVLRGPEWRVESVLIWWFAFGSYAICAAYVSAWWRSSPRQRHWPMLAASMTYLAIIGAWSWVMHMGAGHRRIEWNGEWVSATLIAAAKTLVTAVIGVSAILAIYFATERTRHRSHDEHWEVEPSTTARRKFPIVACLWWPWILVVGLLLANQVIEMRERARTFPMGGGLRQTVPATPSPSGQSAGGTREPPMESGIMPSIP